MITALLLLIRPFTADSFITPKLWLLAVFCCLYAKYHRSDKRIEAAITLFFGSLMLSCGMSGNQQLSILGQASDYATGLLPYLLVLCAYYLGGSKRDFIWGMVLVSLVGIAQAFGWLLLYPLPQGRVCSTIGSPVYLGGLIAMAGALAAGSGRFWPFLVYLPCLYLTHSRAGMIALVIGILMGVTKQIGRKWALFGIAFTLCLPAVHFVLSHKTASKSDLGRKHMTAVAWGLFKENPVVGVGPERFAGLFMEERSQQAIDDLGASYTNGYSHNSLLEALYSQGCIGIIACLFLLWAVYTTSSPELRACGTSIFVYSMFQPTPLLAKAIFAMLLGAEQQNLYDPRTYRQTYVLRAIALAILLAMSAFVVSSKLNFAGGILGDLPLIQKSILFQPTIFQ